MENSAVALWTFVAACITASATVFAAAITAWLNLGAARLTAQAGHVREERAHLLREVEALLHQFPRSTPARTS